MVEKIKNFFLEKEKPFTKKRELKTGNIKKLFFTCVGGLMLLLLVVPDRKNSQSENETFRTTEKLHEPNSSGPDSSGLDSELEAINKQTLKTLSGNNSFRKTKKSLDYLYLDSGNNQHSGRNKRQDNSSDSMIISRDGFSGNTLPISFQIPLVLSRGLKIDGNTEIPVKALVTEDVFYRKNLVIPKGSSFFGLAGFSELERVQIKWHLVQFPVGIQKKIEALSLGMDGRLGVPGKLSGNFSKNLIGSGLSNVIGAYARGSMETTVFGQNRGGHKNGLRNAAAQVATEYGDNLSENMKRKIRWITVPPETRLYALVTKPFLLGGTGHE